MRAIRSPTITLFNWPITRAAVFPSCLLNYAEEKYFSLSPCVSMYTGEEGKGFPRRNLAGGRIRSMGMGAERRQEHRFRS